MGAFFAIPLIVVGAVVNTPGSGPCPVKSSTVSKRVAKIVLKSVHQIQGHSMTSAKLDGHKVSNSSVPFEYSMLLGAGTVGNDGKVYHAGLILYGSWQVGDGETFEFMLAERWHDSILVSFFNNKAEILDKFRNITVNGNRLDDCSETPLFKSTSTAWNMVDNAKKDLALKCSIIRGNEDLNAFADVTNCILFAVRGGLCLGGGEHFKTAATHLFHSM